MAETALTIVNGEIQANPFNTLSVLDRGFAYGDGVFETMLLDQGDIALWQYHLERLYEGLERLHIVLDKQRLYEQMVLTLSAIATHSASSGGSVTGVIKLIVTRGEGARGYMPASESQATLVTLFSPQTGNFRDDNTRYQTAGVRVHYCNEQLPLYPSLAGIKSLNQLPYVLASHERAALDVEEGLLFNLSGHLIEATARNIFLVKDNQLYTPGLSVCGVSGVMRRLILQVITERISVKVSEKVLTREDFYAADEVFLSNSVSGVWPIVQCEDCSWPIGPLTQKIQHEIGQYLQYGSMLSWSAFSLDE